MSQTVFLLSPARCDGRRASYLLNPAATFTLAQRLHGAGVTLGEAFTFMSGLYFRGKLAYARAFARASSGSGMHVIAPGRGLLDPDREVRAADLVAMGAVGVSQDAPAFREPLARDAAALAATLGSADRVVLLGSIATDKYVEVLQAQLDGRLLFPGTFVGRGDMSRGGLMLRHARDGHELEYVPVAGAVRHGPRPPKLEPLRPASRT